MVISSLENKEIKKYYKLKQKKYREATSLFLIEGYHLIEEAYKAKLLTKVILADDIKLDFEVDTIYVSKEVMKKLSSLKTPPKMIGVCQCLNNNDIKGDKILLLDYIQDPGNLGTIIRSSKAFGVDTIILSNDTVDLYNPKVIRATQGVLFHTNIIKMDLDSAIDKLKNNNYLIYATSVIDGVDIKTIDKKQRYALIMGNEGRGVSDKIKSLADCNLYIKMHQEVESLNVAVATSIILYELER